MILDGLHENNGALSKLVADGERRIHVCLKNTDIGQYSKEVILVNKCDALLEMRTVYSKECIDIYYLTGGFETVYELMHIREDFNIFLCITEILHALKCCENYLIRNDELLLIPESIYYDPYNRKIKLMYMPDNDRSISVREAIIEMVDCRISCGVICKDELEKLVDYKKDIFYKNHYNINDLLRITEEAARYSEEADSDFIKDEVDMVTLNKEEEPSIWKFSSETEGLIDLGARLKTMITKLVS